MALVIASRSRVARIPLWGAMRNLHPPMDMLTLAHSRSALVIAVPCPHRPSASYIALRGKNACVRAGQVSSSTTASAATLSQSPSRASFSDAKSAHKHPR